MALVRYDPLDEIVWPPRLEKHLRVMVGLQKDVVTIFKIREILLRNETRVCHIAKPLLAVIDDKAHRVFEVMAERKGRNDERTDSRL